MKSLLIALTVAPLAAFAQGKPEMRWAPQHVWADAHRPKVQIPEMDWNTDLRTRGAMRISAAKARKVVEVTKQTVTSLSDGDFILDMIQKTGDGITKLASMTEEDAAAKVVEAIFTLSELSEKAESNIPDAGAAYSFVTYRTPVKNLEGSHALKDSELRDEVLKGMKLTQEEYRQKGAKDDRKWYLIGATGNVRVVSREKGEAHLQLVLGMKPLVKDLGENKIIIPENPKTADSPVALIDISLIAGELFPAITVTFGKLGKLRPSDEVEWRYRLDAFQGGFCEYADSVPHIQKKVPVWKLGQWVADVPVYAVDVETGLPPVVTGANVGAQSFGYLPLACNGYFGMVRGQFVDGVHGEIDKWLTDSFDLSLNQLGDKVEARERAAKLP